MFEGLYNAIMQLIFIVTALVSVKELTSLITNLVGQGDALKDGADTGKEVMKRVGQTAAIGAMGAGAALKVGQAGLGVARNVGSTIANSSTVQGAREWLNSGEERKGARAFRTFMGTETRSDRMLNSMASLRDKAKGGLSSGADKIRNSRIGQGVSSGVQSISDWGSNAKEAVRDYVETNPYVQGMMSGGRYAAHLGQKAVSGATKAGDWVSGGVSNIRQNIAKDENVSGLIKNATKGLTGVTGATLKASGIAGTVHGLFDDGAIPFADQASAVYKKYTGIKEGKAKKDADDADAAEAMIKQAQTTSSMTRDQLMGVNDTNRAEMSDVNMRTLTDAIVDAIKNININGGTVTVSGYDSEGEPIRDPLRPGEPMRAETSATTEQKAEVHGKVDVNSEQLVNALNEVKNAINNTDKSISNRLGAMLVGIAAVQRSVQDNTRENKSSMEKVEKATQKVAEAVKDKGESAT